VNAPVNGSERTVVVVVRDGSRAVHNDNALERGLARCFAYFEESVLAVVECFGGEAAGGLDVVGVKVGFFAHVVVDGGVEVALVGDDFGWVVGPSVVRYVLCGVAELLKRLIKDGVSVLWHVEFGLDVPNDSHTLYVYLTLVKR
jgi:hypothetical protein